MTITTSPDTDSFIVSQEESNQRLDKFLAERFSEYSRSYFQYLIEEGFVLVNGQKPKKRMLVEPHDEIEVFFQLTPEMVLEPEDIPLEVLYEDEHIIAVNKPAGMVVHPAPGHPNHTFVNALLHHCKNQIELTDDLRPGIVHRLDKNTSGVLLAAKTAQAHRRLITLFCQRKIKKHYLAICQNKPKPGKISAPIGRHPQKRKQMCISPLLGKEAISNIQVVAYTSNTSLVLISPITGRTHQIRVHLQHLKAPILGDEVYGMKKEGIDRQLLHAYQILFMHPITHSEMKIVAPIPDDMKKMIQQIQNSQKTNPTKT